MNYRLNSKRMDCIFEKKKKRNSCSPFKNKIFENYLYQHSCLYYVGAELYYVFVSRTTFHLHR